MGFKLKAKIVNRKTCLTYEVTEVDLVEKKVVATFPVKGNSFENRQVSLDDYKLLFSSNMVDTFDKLLFEGDLIYLRQWKPNYYMIRFIEGGFCLVDPLDSDLMPIDINIAVGYSDKSPYQRISLKDAPAKVAEAVRKYYRK